MFCVKCGAKIDEGEKVCPECGTKVPRTLSRKRKILLAVLAVICIIAVVLAVIFYAREQKKASEQQAPGIVFEEESEQPEQEADEGVYIFADSDKEYLTDSDIQNLSLEELALARNEILARHGRIFEDENSKSYFESQGWYEGTVQPEEFDANYENELNEVEKTNITFISQRENILTQKAQAEQYYASILSEYQQAEQNAFAGDSSQYPHMNRNLLMYGAGGSSLYYTLIDLCNDGTPELFISVKIEGETPRYEMMDIYGYQNGGAAPLYVGIDLGLMPLDENKTMGDRSHYTVCNNNLIREETSAGAEENQVTYYELQENTTTLFWVDSAVQSSVTGYMDYYRSTDGLSMGPSSQEEYNRIVSQYPQKDDISWQKLSDF